MTTFRNPLADPLGTRCGPPLVRGPQFENRWCTTSLNRGTCTVNTFITIASHHDTILSDKHHHYKISTLLNNTKPHNSNKYMYRENHREGSNSTFT